jgi:hypothetical protein
MQSQQDRRAIAMIAVQTPTDFFHEKHGFFFFFGRRSRRVLNKSESAVGPQRIAVSVTWALGGRTNQNFIHRFVKVAFCVS